MDSQVDAISVLLVHLKLEKYSLAAISNARIVAFGIAAEELEKIHKMIIVDSSEFTYDKSLLDARASDNGVGKVEDVFVAQNCQDAE